MGGVRIAENTTVQRRSLKGSLASVREIISRDFVPPIWLKRQIEIHGHEQRNEGKGQDEFQLVTHDKRAKKQHGCRCVEHDRVE